jgi:hypothetical protein
MSRKDSQRYGIVPGHTKPTTHVCGLSGPGDVYKLGIDTTL